MVYQTKILVSIKLCANSLQVTDRERIIIEHYLLIKLDICRVDPVSFIF